MTNVYPFSFAGGPVEVRTNIDTGHRSGVVQVDYDYNPILPSLLFLNNTIHFTTRTAMCNEGN